MKLFSISMIAMASGALGQSLGTKQGNLRRVLPVQEVDMHTAWGDDFEPGHPDGERVLVLEDDVHPVLDDALYDVEDSSNEVQEKGDRMQSRELGYPNVSVVNSTPYTATGDVDYDSCSTDHFDDLRNGQSTNLSRGLCLVSEICASLSTPSGDIACECYSSSGTSYSQYALIMTGSNTCEVTRRVS